MEKVECGAFSGEQVICGCGDGEYRGAWLDKGSVGGTDRDFWALANALKDFCGDVGTGNDERLLGKESGGGGGRIGEKESGKIALAYVLIESVADGVMRGEGSWMHTG